MPKPASENRSKPRLRRLATLALLLAASVLAAAQTNPGGASDDAEELLQRAAKVNGLSDGGQPWHLKASFQVFTAEGTPENQGTYEEFWVSPVRFKRIYTSPLFSQVEYGTASGPKATGSRASAPDPLRQLQRQFVNPSPILPMANSLRMKADARQIEGVQRMCLDFLSPIPSAVSEAAAPAASYCFDQSGVVVEADTNFRGKVQSRYSNPVAFAGRILPGDVEMTTEGGSRLEAHLESIEPLAEDQAMFDPPADATPEIFMVGEKGVATAGAKHPRPTLIPANPNQVSISAGIAVGLMLTKVDPVYPPVARAARVQGTVVLEAIIDEEGNVADLKAISGPPLLIQAAIDAVQQWTYRPYLFNGQPVEVRTTVNVVFRLAAQPDKAQ
jgi:TonB family protein